MMACVTRTFLAVFARAGVQARAATRGLRDSDQGPSEGAIPGSGRSGLAPSGVGARRLGLGPRHRATSRADTAHTTARRVCLCVNLTSLGTAKDYMSIVSRESEHERLGARATRTEPRADRPAQLGGVVPYAHLNSHGIMPL